MSDGFYTTYAAGAPDPYHAIETLRHGSSSYVEKVTKEGDESWFYACKPFICQNLAWGHSNVFWRSETRHLSSVD